MRLGLTILAAAVAVAVLSACSSDVRTANSTLPGFTMRAGRPYLNLSRSGVVTPMSTEVQPIVRARRRIEPTLVSWQHSLFVDDGVNNAVKLFNDNTWAANGSFTNGVSGPDGNWSDHKYLYVANYYSVKVEEYRPNHTTPVFAYTTGLTDPVDVTTQVVGGMHYVFVADFEGGFVNEYKRNHNTVIATCSPGNYVEDVAVAPSGDVFVDYIDSNAVGRIVEYVGGMAGCNGTVLPVAFNFPTGMVLDNAGRLIVCDQIITPQVDIVDPPYTSISGTLGSGYSQPFHVTISDNNDQAFVTDSTLKEVFVLQYPSGVVQHTLGSADGLTTPYGAVLWRNFGS